MNLPAILYRCRLAGRAGPSFCAASRGVVPISRAPAVLQPAPARVTTSMRFTRHFGARTRGSARTSRQGRSCGRCRIHHGARLFLSSERTNLAVCVVTGAGSPRFRRACPDRQSLDGFTAGVAPGPCQQGAAPRVLLFAAQRSRLDERQPHQTLYLNVRYLSRSMGNAPQRHFIVRAERRKQSPFHGLPAVKSYAGGHASQTSCRPGSIVQEA